MQLLNASKALETQNTLGNRSENANLLPQASPNSPPKPPQGRKTSFQSSNAVKSTLLEGCLEHLAKWRKLGIPAKGRHSPPGAARGRQGRPRREHYKTAVKLQLLYHTERKPQRECKFQNRLQKNAFEPRPCAKHSVFVTVVSFSVGFYGVF